MPSRDEEAVALALGMVVTSLTEHAARTHAYIARNQGATPEELASAWNTWQAAREDAVVQP